MTEIDLRQLQAVSPYTSPSPLEVYSSATMVLASLTRTNHRRSYAAITPSRPALSLSGKTIIISDSTSPIGLAAAQSFAKAGCTSIGLIGNDNPSLEHTKACVLSVNTSIKVFTAVVDLSRNESIGLAAHEIRVALGAWDVFIHTASHKPRLTTLAGADEDDWFQALQVNVLFYKHFATHFSPKARPNATFIDVTDSICTTSAGLRKRESGWAASQAGAIKCQEYLAQEKDGLRLFSVSTDSSSQPHEQSQQVVNGEVENDPTLAGDFFVWLASSEADFLQGRFVSVSWDIEELLKCKTEIEQDQSLLRLDIAGVMP